MTEVPTVRLPSDHWRRFAEPYAVRIEQQIGASLTGHAMAILAEMAQTAAESQRGEVEGVVDPALGAVEIANAVLALLPQRPVQGLDLGVSHARAPRASGGRLG